MRLVPGRRQRISDGHLVDLEIGMEGTTAGRLVGVTGSGGAPGKTFIAVNVAVGLAEQGLSVCLLDADPGLGTVAAHLDLHEDRSLHYLAHESTLVPVDDELIERHLQRFGRLAVLTGRFQADSGALSPAVFETVVDRLRRRFQLLVADLGPLTWPASVAMADQCQLVVWVVTPTPIGADLFDRAITSTLAARLRPKASLALVNGRGDGALDQVETALGHRYGLAVGPSVSFSRAACLASEAAHRPAVMGGPLKDELSRVATTVARAVLLPTPSVGDAEWAPGQAPPGWLSAKGAPS